ncbi:trimethylamine-N-oxide reductase (cytochrome c), cytochrome c-type subunit TorC [Pseudovibrio denitrificans]|uniref:Cytochrome c-type protein n=2 Tax=Pseudovibrio denitrificans TaxID=258256 RepID=A0A1I6ZUU9_9HYPH|nr:NapC/NirT family cytochrome c [Pseudovibrio denitrificans]SFT66469.1 trimethylamine-N-oxide reductase (cytochrome c), cytochrome c-type subunit TorC [Pseudovibrio denitrificans]
MKIWRLLRTKTAIFPISLLLIGAFAGGIVFWGGFHTAMDYTNTLDFCVSCHEMRSTVYEEYKKSPHFSNASGVQAVCSDCHVPKETYPKILRKIKAAKEVYSKLTGKIDTKEKFEAHRLTMAKSVWAEMEANDSQQCRNCHKQDSMDFAKQHPKASETMQKGFKDGETCISCHKGIAHKLPDMSQGYKAMYDELQALSANEGATSDHLYAITSKPFFVEQAKAESNGKSDGRLMGGTDVTVLERSGDLLKVRIAGWQQDEVDRVIYALRGQRIFSATVGKKVVDKIERLKTEVDPDTELTWHQVQIDTWVSKENLISEGDQLWAYTKEMYTAACSTCHGLRDPEHFLANQWIGSLKAMKRFISLDKEQYRILQKYLQLNAKDTGGSEAHG